MTGNNQNKRQFFGTDGVRGTVGVPPLTPDFVTRLGYAAGVVLSQRASHPTFTIGRDTRQSGEMLQSALKMCIRDRSKPLSAAACTCTG